MMLSFIIVGLLTISCCNEVRAGVGPTVAYAHIGDGPYCSEGRLSILPSQSLAQCCGECYVESGCSIVGYVDSKKICMTYTWSFLDGTALGTTSTDVQYYKVTCPGVHADYRYETSINSCVSSKRARMDWHDARATCDEENAHIMFARNQAEFDYLTDYIKTQHDGVKLWVGGYETGDNIYSWTSGTLINSTNGGQFWKENRPRADLDTGCMRVQYVDTDSGYKLADNNCKDSIHGFYCQIDVE